jgi:glutamyl-tRNA synthetase
MKTTQESSLEKLNLILPILEVQQQWNQEAIHDLLVGFAETHEIKNGQIMWPIRTAVSGVEVTPGGAVELLAILGKEESLRRIRMGIRLLEVSIPLQQSM